MSLQWDNKISLGHVLTFVGMLATGITAFVYLSVGQAQMEREMIAVRADAVAREGRIRAVEIAQASQSSDLRAIQNSLTRIEAAVERLQPKP